MIRKRKTGVQEAESGQTLRTPVTRYKPDYREGLSSRQVREYAEGGWMNTAVTPPSQSVKEIVHENVFTYFNLVFAVLAVLLILVGSLRSLTFLPVIIANILIGIIQEIRSKNVLEKMTMLNAPHAKVVRDGSLSTINSERLVLDDIVIFKSGNQVCADAVVAAGEVRVDESMLTGESDEIVKKRGDNLMSGSFIVAGQCHARLSAVGEDSYISKLTLEAKAMKKGEKSEMMRSLSKLVKFIGIVLIPIGAALVIQSFFFNHTGLQNSITSMVAAVIGMIPEGLYLLTSVALAVSSIRLAKQNVLLHDMKSIETLARVNVLCVDKTGTITENSMSVYKMIPADAPDKEQSVEDDLGEAEPFDLELSELLGDFVQAMGSDNSTMEALKEYFTDQAGRTALKVVPFASKTKYSGVIFKEGSYVLGAPEFVLRDEFAAYKHDIETHTKKGYRVVVFASYDGQPDGEVLTGHAVPLAFILLSNPIRKEAPATFRYFKEQGVDVKVISGDNPVTVSETAKLAEIENAEKYVDASTLKTKEDIADAMLRYTVFGRVTPEQKRQFVQTLKKQGKTVAMTGDGVNDVLALKDADCSVAMASGSDAAMQASQVVLLNSDFSCMPSVVLEGRRVVNNIQRSASLFLVKNIYSLLLSLFSVAFMITYPLEPSQISLISMFSIGIPAFFLAFQPNTEVIKGHFLSNVFLKALPAGVTGFLAVGALAVFGQTFGVGSKDISTAATILLAIVGFMILYRICKPMNTLRGIIWGGCILGMVVCSIFLPKLFAITDMSTKCIMLFVVFSIATEPVHHYITAAVERLRSLYLRIFQKEK